MLSSLIFIVAFLRSYVAVTVRPNTSAAGISVSLINDPREPRLNEVDANNRWKLEDSASNPLNNWGLRINLDANTYGFKSGASDSSVTVSVDADIGSSEADLFVGVGIGDQYVTYAVDLDGSLWLQSNSEENKGGVWTFPQCSTGTMAPGTMARGDVSTLLLAENLDSSVGYQYAVRDALCGGDDEDAQLLTSTRNNGALPVTLQLTSDDVAKTLEITFSTPTYENAPLSCTFDVSGSGASVVGQDLDIFLNNDGGAGLEIVQIKSVDVTASNVGTAFPTFSPVTAPTTANPTTANPTTANPTTANPTTANPTTADPTTANPTTANPTTANPTTADPTTANPTTANPTTASPTDSPTLRATTTSPTRRTTTTRSGGVDCSLSVDEYLQECACDSAAQSVLFRPASPLNEEMNALQDAVDTLSFQVHFLMAMTAVITCMTVLIAYLLYQASAAKRVYGKVYQMDSDTDVENSRLKA